MSEANKGKWYTHAITVKKDGYSKCSKILNTRCLPKKALTNSADPNQTASEEAV